jgi:hypothetical protein
VNSITTLRSICVVGCKAGSTDLIHDKNGVMTNKKAAQLVKVALLASGNVHTGDGHCGSIQVCGQDALVAHGGMSSCVHERIWLQACKQNSDIAPCFGGEL